jgi:cation diffusion facilitator family transporter
MVCATVLNFLIARYEHRRGSELKSEILVADSFHTKSDVYASVSVIFGLIAVKAGFVVFDPLIAILIAFLIARTAYHIIKHASHILCDTSMIKTLEIKEIAQSVEGVLDCHKIRTRGTFDEVYVDLHVTVKSELTVEKGHEISTNVEEGIKKKLGQVRDVVVHIEPKKK